MIIPFTKAHGAKNDFVMTWASDLPRCDLRQVAIAICDRHTGVGADGWYIVRPPDEEADASARLFNSDGSEPEMSGNGTRCVAALLIASGHAQGDVTIYTGAGLKHLKTISREENRFDFEMDMGTPRATELETTIDLAVGPLEATLVDAGNPQCVVFVDDFHDGWQSIGAALERHPRFPNRTNVSFVRVIDRNTIDVRFFERGVGETMSSGTGSTGAAAAAIARGLAESPVQVQTPAGSLLLEWRGETAFLAGPAEIIARGEFYL